MHRSGERVTYLYEMAKKAQRVDRTVKDSIVERMAEMVRREVRERLGPNSTYEQRRDAAVEVMSDVLWKDADHDLRESTTDADEIDIDGIRYRRLVQSSSATYYGRWGPHEIEEALYREVGVRNGRTIKPLEAVVGMIARHMTPDFARIMGELSAHQTSREVANTLRIVGLAPPGRAFLENRFKQMAGEIANDIALLEGAAREVEAVSEEIAAISVGLDRFATRMAEPAETTMTPRTKRAAPYQRTPPPPKEYHWRKAWVGSMTVYDKDGNVLQTRQYAAEAGIEAMALAERVVADVARIFEAHPGIPVHCIQDAAPELRAMPEALTQMDIPACLLVDFEHLMGYLDEVVDACEPENDPYSMKSWYRTELLRDDNAIDRIWRGLRARSKVLAGRNTRARRAVAAALSYIRDRKDMMRYASFHAAKLPIGSGATESTCWAMQQRVKRAGQSWETPGLQGTLSVRALVLSERWTPAWNSYAAGHRAEVRSLC